MEHTGTDAVDPTVRAYEFALEEVRGASFNLIRALMARALNSGNATTIEKECADGHSVYERMIRLYTRMPVEDMQRASLLKELGLLRASLEECEAQDGRYQPTRKSVTKSSS